MKTSKAILRAYEIITECEKHAEENGCLKCPFWTKSGICMVSGGNDIPIYWHLKEKMDELLEVKE